MPVDTLDARLAAAAEYVRQGACFADVGTDHALLPLFLLADRRVKLAYATDVAEGPLARAAEAVAAAGESARVKLLLRDGLLGMESLGLTDIALCGMGGELIVRILETAPFVRNPAVRLILQPMTRAAVLRRYLAGAGFRVESETFSLAARRPYVCLAASYTGEPYSLTPAEEELGRESTWKNPKTPPFYAYCEKRLAALEKEARGEKTDAAARLPSVKSIYEKELLR